MDKFSKLYFLFVTTTIVMAIVPSAWCDDSNKTSRIQGRVVGGQEAEPYQYPFAMWWKFGRRGQGFCGGTLSELYGIQFVVTAAHCVWRGYPFKWSSIDRRQVKMYFGSHSIINKTYIQIRRPAKIVFHENWDEPPTMNDIAVMFIHPNTPLPLSSAIMPIEIAPAAYKTPAAVTIMGWGALQLHQRSPGVLHYRQMRSYEANVCHYYAPRITQYQFCVLADDIFNYAGTCEGDSGSPVVAFKNPYLTKMYLVGVVSYHSPADKCGICSVYTKVSAYGKWISDQVLDFKREMAAANEGRSSHFEYIDK